MIGYMILTTDEAGQWKADWDGEIHTDPARAQEEFRLCTEAGYQGRIAMVVWPQFTYKIGDPG